MADKFDFKTAYKDLYLPGKKPSLIEVPAMTFFMVDGVGDPQGESYQEAMSILYSLTFTVKMSKMSGQVPEGYFDYVLPPLEGLWETPGNCFTGDMEQRKQWKWTSMIRQPDFVTPSVFQWAKEQAAKKHPEIDFSRARLEEYAEGLSAQVMHWGPYSEEQVTIDRLQGFIKENGLRFHAGYRHHEIYLGDPRKTAPERLRTVLRHPVEDGKGE